MAAVGWGEEAGNRRRTVLLADSRDVPASENRSREKGVKVMELLPFRQVPVQRQRQPELEHTRMRTRTRTRERKVRGIVWKVVVLMEVPLIPAATHSFSCFH